MYYIHALRKHERRTADTFKKYMRVDSKHSHQKETSGKISPFKFPIPCTFLAKLHMPMTSGILEKVLTHPT